jgi:hypothetical protein
VSTTWDGKPIAAEPPFGATVVVYRFHSGRVEFLLLHRSHEGADHEGDWAWTPPAGARQPDERVEECAARELHEEAGLTAQLELVRLDGDWALFSAEADSDARVVLHDTEHDRFEWVPIDVARVRCRPQRVADMVVEVADRLGGG